MRRFGLLLLVAAMLTACAVPAPASTTAQPTTLRIGVSLTPEELDSFTQGVNAIQAQHPEWKLVIEQTPQSGINEKINANIAAGTLPDVQQVQGLFALPWIRQGAFRSLESYLTESGLPLDDFYPGTFEQFTWQEERFALPFIAAPDLIYYNQAMFDAAGLPYPTDDWTWDDLRAMARLLTLDSAGRNADAPDFNADDIVQWGYNANPGSLALWAVFFVAPFGGDFCANPDCTQVNFTSAANLAALQWWADFVSVDHATLHDPYGGSQTGVPGDPFIAGKTAMGNNGFFAIGQLREAASFPWDIVQPPSGPSGERATVLSTSGWVIAANSPHADAAWQLIQELTATEFLAEYWVTPGHSMPARRSASDVVLELPAPPANRAAIQAAMEYGRTFRPSGPGAFEAFGKMMPLALAAMRGEQPVADAYAQAEQEVNAILQQAEAALQP